MTEAGVSVFWQDPAWIAAITGLGAIAFSFSSLLVQKHLATFQIRAALKEKWVNEFRDNITSYLTCSARIHDVFAAGVDLGRLNAVEDERKAYSEYDIYNERAHQLAQKISLFLNEKNEIHFKLIHELKIANDILQEWKKEILSNKINENKRMEIASRGTQVHNQIIDAAREIVVYELKDIL